MKKFLLILCLVILQTSTVFASVEKHIDKQINYEMEYPIVYTKNQAAQNKINQDIYKHIATFRNDYNSGKFYKGKFYYQVKFENSNYISLTVSDSRYNMGAAHNQYFVYGLVYDKNSGRKLPLSNFVKITLKDLKSVADYHLYNESGTKIELLHFHKIEHVSNDYYLLGNGGIALIYQPYELASFADGATTIRLTQQEIDCFNRKNKNL